MVLVTKVKKFSERAEWFSFLKIEPTLLIADFLKELKLFTLLKQSFVSLFALPFWIMLKIYKIRPVSFVFLSTF